MCIQNIAVFQCQYWECGELVTCEKSQDCTRTVNAFQARFDKCPLCKSIQDAETVISLKCDQIEQWAGLGGGYGNIIQEINQEIEDLRDAITGFETEHQNRRYELMPN